MAIRAKEPSISQESFVSSYRTTFDTSILDAHNLVTSDYENIALEASELNTIVNEANVLQNSFKTDIIDELEADRVLMQLWIDTLSANDGATWSSTIAYKKNDVVNYGDTTYLCLQDTPAGTPLSDITYWVVFDIKGVTGYNSLGVIWKGIYQSGISYDQYDLVYITTGSQYLFYVANQDMTTSGTTPVGDANWTRSLIIDRRNLIYTDTPPVDFQYPYDWLYLEKTDDYNDVTVYNIVNNIANGLNIVTTVPNVVVDTTTIPYISVNTQDMSTAIQSLYAHYNLK